MRTTSATSPPSPDLPVLDHPACPVCDATAADTIGEQTFVRDTPGLSAYVAERYRVLFELWSPGASSVTIRFQCCRQCGMVWYSPRPTADEVDAKYRRLGGAHSSTVHDPVATPLDRERSLELLQTLRSGGIAPGAQVLDFGGGTGSLMVEFVREGYRCALVDYSPEAIAGVERLADTLEGLPPETKFDAIIASHVLEHVPHPVWVAQRLAERLTPQGVLYVEVPLELVGGPPRLREPVTHLHFFAVSSMRALLRRAGLQVTRCWVEATIHANGRAALAVRALATPGGIRGQVVADAEGVAEVRGLLKTRGLQRLAWLALRHPRIALRRFHGKPRGA